ncbi:MAG: adenylyl-sulfate reductase subunit alpha [Myxococcales bacterium]|nr:adenylyl-sulfate reductase subunit alpha [Myxococcales bacterium]MDD9969105.1 adenylyl-sulfate reductase subunit alpha [Myxococcales bacterium]
MTSEVVEHNCDLLIIGGGAAGCVAAVEARERAPELDVLLLEKAHIYRSGCLAAGISALNAYLHPGETPESFLRYVVRETHGIVRDDLTLTMAAELNEQVRKVGSWGLPIPRDELGRPLKRGRASIKIFGERIKPIVAKRAEASGARILNRVNVTGLAVCEGRVVGAYGFGVRDGRFHVVRARRTLVCTGGASGLYRPSNPGGAAHRMWYSPFNTGAGLAMGIRAGAEMTSFEFRFIPLRIKDAIAPTGEIAQWLGARQINARGERYLEKYYQHLGGQRMTTQDRLHATLMEHRAGRGPCYLDLRGVEPRRLEDTVRAYLSMAPSSAMIMSDEAYYARAGGEMAPIEITGGEPHVVGGHGLSGYWVDAQRRTTLPGLWAAGDVVGGVPKKYASGAWAEAVIAVRDMIDAHHADISVGELELAEQCRAERARVFAPRAHRNGVPAIEMEERLQKVMDEYAGGISQQYGYSEGGLKLAKLHLSRLEHEQGALMADDVHSLLLCHDVIDRITVAQQLVAHMDHRKETRWRCYQERLDHPLRDDARWHVFVNSVRHPDGRIEMRERQVERAQVQVVLPPLSDGAVVRRRRNDASETNGQ